MSSLEPSETVWPANFFCARVKHPSLPSTSRRSPQAALAGLQYGRSLARIASSTAIMSGAGQLQPLDLEAQAAVLDQADDLRHLRDEFVIPTRADIQRQTLAKHGWSLLAHPRPFVVDGPPGQGMGMLLTLADG